MGKERKRGGREQREGKGRREKEREGSQEKREGKEEKRKKKVNPYKTLSMGQMVRTSVRSEHLNPRLSLFYMLNCSK